MKIAICDDLQKDRDELKECLETMIKNYTITEFEDGKSLVEAHRHYQFDLIFLDCIMPELSGMDTAAEMRKTDTDTPIIFISTSSEFGVDSYRVFAYDYILKPIDKMVLYRTLKRFINGFVKKQYISIMFQGIPTKILISNIVCVESNGHKLLFTLIDNRELVVSGKLSDYEEKLSENGFIRCHKSYIVNAECAEDIRGDVFLLENGRQIKISRAYLKIAKEKYFNYVFGKIGTNED